MTFSQPSTTIHSPFVLLKYWSYINCRVHLALSMQPAEIRDTLRVKTYDDRQPGTSNGKKDLISFSAPIRCSSGSGGDFSQLIDWNIPSFIRWRNHKDFNCKDIPHGPDDIKEQCRSATSNNLRRVKSQIFPNYSTQIIVLWKIPISFISSFIWWQ